MSKKIAIALSMLIALVVLACTPVSALAMGPTKSGVYEVPVEMWHAEKEKTSMGDSYIVHTALLTVDGKKKTLTIASAESAGDMQFWYYKDGGVTGETVEVEQKENVKIDGTSYATAFEFPIESDNEFVGVKFAASIMPLSPSARIKIDYSGAKKIADVTKATTTTTTVPATETTTAPAADSQEKGSNKTAIIIGTVAGVAVLAAVIGVIVKKKSN